MLIHKITTSAQVWLPDIAPSMITWYRPKYDYLISAQMRYTNFTYVQTVSLVSVVVSSHYNGQDF